MEYLITVVETWRVPDMKAADELEMTFRQDSTYSVLKCVKTEKNRRAKGEIVDEWVLVQITKVFNDVKEPNSYVKPTYN
jgi:hypothetical protein